MCGIAGFYCKNNVDFVSREELEEMTTIIEHRGKDSRGVIFSDNFGLGHQRLSIVDLSNNAQQPMNSASFRYVCVFNGEVYNFQSIAKDLNLTQKTQSDTEVVIEAFAQWGLSFVNKLNGMFAIAIFDRQEEKLYLFRDRLGIKPLFYYWDGSRFAFSSEIKSLLTINYIRNNRKINKVAISPFLHLGYIPEPNTIYQNIHKFPSGSCGIISETGFRIESYWKVEGSLRSNVIKNFEEAKFKLKNLIEDSVKIRIDSCDVDFGTFLSGGIDSSLITAVADKYKKTNKLKTFSIGFKEDKYDESKYAEKIANYLNTEHKTFIISQLEVREIIEEVFDFYDEPYSDSSAIPTMILSKHTKNDVSMVLSGDGGDELFLGYGSYKWARRLSSPLGNQFVRKAITSICGKLPDNRFRRASKLFDFQDNTTLRSHIFSQEQYFFDENELNNLLCPDYANIPNFINQNFDNFVRKMKAAEEQSIFDLRYYLKDDLLVKVDRASMKYALEVRIPLLDYRIVALALNIDPHLKMYKKTQKYLLKQILFDYIPKQYFNREKWGFSIPLKEWLFSDKYISDLIIKYLDKNTITTFGIVKYDEVVKLINLFRSGHDYLYNRIWALIILHKFLLRNDNLNKY